VRTILRFKVAWISLLVPAFGLSPAEDGTPAVVDYWSYRPVERVPVPHADWPRDDSVAARSYRNPIDSFVLAEQSKRGLVPSLPADPAVLLRRVYLDLIGLPPTRDELHAFLADPSDVAYERIVDRLLASAHYGERWGRHWMDVWRYSDWYGSRAINEIRYSQRHIWRWRDWIIESLNADKGYDRMVLEMLAGDELAPAHPSVTRATGFIGRNWYKFDRNVWMFDAVEHTAQAFLGLTLRCARCHDHKYDPISHQDYYRFRAFFEPHDVRTDPLSATVGMQKDATLGQVLNDGLARVYDKQPDSPTFVFTRGDNRYPDEKQRVEPGVPSAFGLNVPSIEPLALPVESYAPWLVESIVAEKIELANRSVTAAETRVEGAQLAIASAARSLAEWIDRESSGLGPDSSAAGTAFTDDFQQPRLDVWRAVSGHWLYDNGHVAQTEPGPFSTMVSTVQHPQDFSARLRYKTTEAGTIHSVGLFFDVVELRDCQAVYTATNNEKSSVQAFHRQAGAEHYPEQGISAYPIQIGQEITLDLAVRGQQLNVWINGDLAIAYTMPMPRQAGTLALWTHAGTAEFYELLVDVLPPEARLASSVGEQVGSPYAVPSKLEMETSLKVAQRAGNAALQRLALSRAELAALKSRVAADRAKVHESSDAETLAQIAADEERQAKLYQAELDAMLAEHKLFEVRVSQRGRGAGSPASVASSPSSKTADARNKAIADAEVKLGAARKALDNARAEATKQHSTYSSLGPIYPQSSTGRRLALARWIADPRNPRTARIAVNHIWLRHFGQALVPTVANFGLNGNVPSHPGLLDWLAAEFMDHDWSMKHLHRMIVLSNTYRQSSSQLQREGHRIAAHATGAVARPGTAAHAIDPENRFLWRMNARRMESEVVRDSILSASGQLDTAFGGPEIAESQGQESRRRSLYFRSTPNEKMAMLEVFDQANPNECYRRQESVMPQQSLALSNSVLCLNQSRLLARRLTSEAGSDSSLSCTSAFVVAAFEQVLSRAPTAEELRVCQKFLARHTALIRSDQAKTAFSSTSGAAALAPAADSHIRARENLVHVLFNHNEFVTIR
jgi:hypothetical protein